MATNLYNGTELVWLDKKKIVLTGDDFLDALMMSPDGSDKVRINTSDNVPGNAGSVSDWKDMIFSDYFEGIYNSLVTGEC